MDAPQLLGTHTFRAVDPLLVALDKAAALEHVDSRLIDATRQLAEEIIAGQTIEIETASEIPSLFDEIAAFKA